MIGQSSLHKIQFETKSHEALEQLGQAFYDKIHDYITTDRDGSGVKIGLQAVPGTGKSTFINGMLKDVKRDSTISIDKADNRVPAGQIIFTREFDGAGVIVAYDSNHIHSQTNPESLSGMFDILKEKIHETPPALLMVEHPNAEERQASDFAIKLQKKCRDHSNDFLSDLMEKKSSRIVEIQYPPGFEGHISELVKQISQHNNDQIGMQSGFEMLDM